MSMQPRKAPQLPSDGKLRHPSSMQLLFSSAQAAWPNLLLQHYRYSATHTQVSVPARAEETTADCRHAHPMVKFMQSPDSTPHVECQPQPTAAHHQSTAINSEQP